MGCFHEGHDGDCSHDTECPTCREIVHDPAGHTCIPVYPPDCCMEERP